MSDVNLSISKEIVNPIIREKINQVVLEALGGTDSLVRQVVDEIVERKVNKDGNVSTSNYDNKYRWLDITVTNQITKAIEEELKRQITEASSTIKQALIEQIRTKRGSSLIAKALMDGLEDSFKSSWRSKINVVLQPLNND